MITAGLTGGPGSGKSAALAVFSKLGWATFDADTLCREIYEERPPELLAALSGRWGAKGWTPGPGGQIDRGKIAEIVFSDRRELEWLNSLTHPLIRARLDAAAAKAPQKNIMVEAALLFEAGWDAGMDVTIAVWADSAAVRARLLARGWTERDIDLRSRAQMPPGEKLERAAFGVVNNGGLDHLEKQIISLNKTIKEREQ